MIFPDTHISRYTFLKLLSADNMRLPWQKPWGGFGFRVERLFPLVLVILSELVPGPGGAEEALLEVADPELPDLQQAKADALHREQHGHADLRAGQTQPQGAAVLGDPRTDVQ